MGPLPKGFDMLQYFETILLSAESYWASQQDEVYSGHHLRFYQVLKIKLKPQEIFYFPVLDI